MLLVMSCEGLELRCLGSGRLHPWLGAAVRGMTGLPYKKSVCQLLPGSSTSDELPACAGCPHMANCGYGQTFEPDAPSAAVARGKRQAPRPFVLSPDFPTPTAVEEGSRLGLRALFLGPAVAHVDEVFTQLKAAGEQNGLGDAGHRVRVSLEKADSYRQSLFKLEPNDLPKTIADGVISRLRLELRSPLRMLRRQTPRSRKELIAEPTLADFFLAAFRLINELFAIHHRPLEADERGLLAAASEVVTHAAGWRHFRQATRANHGRRKYHFDALVGWAEFSRVPVSLLPWLQWGGLLHVGDRRVNGCGGWQLQLN